MRTTVTKKITIVQEGKFIIEVVEHSQPSEEDMKDLGKRFERLFDKKEKKVHRITLATQKIHLK
ncbi:hypothetical protein [Bacillus paramycoides]|uniref:hypothetical protein n=1 Tax=Bacillus paramycoides TaxID=2026194 RepID=UPI003D02AEB7